MLLSSVQLSIRSICGINFLRSVNQRSKIKCRYTKWASRTPIAIVNEHELSDDTTNDAETTETKVHEKVFKTRKERSKPQRGKEQKKKENVNKAGETIITEQGYTCFKADDRLIKYV